MSGLLTMVPGVAAMGAGVLALRLVWARSGLPWRAQVAAAGACLLLLSLLLWAWMAGPDLGLPFGLLCFSLIGLAAVILGVEVRPERLRRRAPVAVPAVRRASRWLGMARFLLAGPLGLLAAMGVGIAMAMQGPMVEQTRLVLGGLLVPILWAGCMAWTLCDARVGRAALVLAGVAVAGYATALLPLVLHV